MIELGIIRNVKNFAYEKEDLEKLSTERLVGFISHLRTWYKRYFNEIRYEGDYESTFKEYIDKYVCVYEVWPDNYPTEYYWADENMLREILKTRPNIPNKIQRKKAIKDMIAKNKKKVKRNLIYRK